MNLFFVQICIIVINQLDGLWSKSINYEIDELINRVLRSDKFDELADKIAEKAARKIFDLDNIRISHNIDSIKTRNQEGTLSQKQILRENYVEETTPSLKEIKTEATTKNIELDTKQIYVRDKSSTQEKLRLKYKNLSKSSRGDKKHIVYNIENHDLIVQSTKADPVDVFTERHSHKNKLLKVASHKGNALKTKSKSDITVENIKYSIEVKNEENEDSGDKKNSDEDRRSIEEKETQSNVNDRPKVLEIDVERNEKKTMQESKEKRQTQSKIVDENDSKNENESKEKASNEDSPKPTEDGEADDSEKDKESEEKDSNIRKSFDKTTEDVIIHKEGNKLYAIQNLPDYQEYQAKVKKQNIHRKEVLLKYK